MSYNDTFLNIRLPRKLKEEAILARIPLTAVCRSAIKEKVLTGNGGLPVENIRSLKQATQVFNKIQPVFDVLITENNIYEFSHSGDPLALLKSKIPVIPDKFLRNFVDFCLGGHFSEQILSIYLEERSECLDNVSDAETQPISQTT